MGKKNERFSKIYREFTRVKFQKYRLQFPRVRQSELISKILKEWEAMDENAKDKLQAQYIERSGKNFLEAESSSDKKKQDKDKKASQPMSSSARQAKTKPIKKPKKPSPKVRVFKQKSTQNKMGSLLDDFNRSKQKEDSKSPGKKSTPDKKQSSSSELAIRKAKGKIGVSTQSKKTGKSEEYHNFFKYYHDRLTAEHPRWTANQIGTIIKLLWRKRHIKDSKKKRTVSGKILSGRQLYSRTKLSEGFPKQQVKLLWRALPFQSKKYWQIKGQGRPHRSDKDSGRFVRRVLNAGASNQPTAKQPEASLNWMNKQIK